MRPKKVILLCDSNEQTLSTRTFLLETRGYSVLRSTTSAQALDTIATMPVMNGPRSLDLLVTDLLLPGMDGNTLARHAKTMHPTLPVLIVSKMIGSFDRELHADGFLPKGASSSIELLEKIRVLTARKRGPKRQQTAEAA